MNWTGFSLTRVDTRATTNVIVDGRVGVGTTTPSSKLSIYNTTETYHFTIGGNEFRNPSATGSGIALVPGINRSGNKQLWIMDPDASIGSTIGALRIVPGLTNYVSMSGISNDGNTTLPISFPCDIGVNNINLNQSNNPTITFRSVDWNQSNNILFQALDLSRNGYLKFQETGSNATTLRIGVDNSYARPNNNFFTQDIIFETNAAERLKIDKDGNVGIGTNNPGARLDVRTSSTNGTVIMQMGTYSASGTTYGYVPMNSMKIYGATSGYNANSAEIGLQPFYNGSWPEGPIASMEFRLSGGAWSGNDWGQRPEITVMKLYGWGGAWLLGTLTQSSDITLKKNIEPLPYGLQTISSLNPVAYHFNNQDDSTKKHFGLIAQEVQEILPQLVDKGSDDKLSLSYIELVPVLINAVKEQQQTIASMSDRLSRLESLLSR